LILTFESPFGSTLSLDLRKRLGETVELQSFQFVTPPIEFRLTRLDVPLQDWQRANTEIYDLQHGPSVATWERASHRFTNDLRHRNDVMTCGVLSRDVFMETRGLALQFVLLVWPRETTVRAQRVDLVSL
jgi:hypothetical protein